ncbi:MAG: endolytic transglycosylase MltG [Casimicrobiaceae bacterium]
MLKRILSLLGVLVLAAALVWVGLPHWPARQMTEGAQLVIPQGASLPKIAAEIERIGVAPAWTVRLVARKRGTAARLKPGTYRLDGIGNVGELLEAIESGRALLATLKMVEGMNLRELHALLEKATQPPHRLSLDEVETIEDINARFGQGYPSAEGWFFPDTYAIAPGSSARALLATMHERMKRELDQVWQARAPNLPLRNPYEALILASIIEKETGREADRPLVASVFINRLRLGMRLQTDPTVIYGLGADFDGDLRKRDLVTDTPYNTYTRGGLPPTPIAMPGRASLRAAVAPAETDYLYFVARGDGSSEFSRNLAEHNRAVARYQLKR